MFICICYGICVRQILGKNKDTVLYWISIIPALNLFLAVIGAIAFYRGLKGGQ